MNIFLNRQILTIIFIVGIIGCAGNNTNKDTVTGTINVRGNAPFTYLSIEDGEGKVFEVVCPDSLREKLWDLQGITVTLDVKDVKKNLDKEVLIIENYQVKNTKMKDIKE